MDDNNNKPLYDTWARRDGLYRDSDGKEWNLKDGKYTSAHNSGNYQDLRELNEDYFERHGHILRPLSEKEKAYNLMNLNKDYYGVMLDDYKKKYGNAVLNNKAYGYPYKEAEGLDELVNYHYNKDPHITFNKLVNIMSGIRGKKLKSNGYDMTNYYRDVAREALRRNGVQDVDEDEYYKDEGWDY